MDRKNEILRELVRAGDYVSGQELCRKLGVSRTAVWKCISRLREEGYVIEAVTNRGYRLRESGGGSLDRRSLEGALDTLWAGHPLIYKEETGSTNEDIFRLAEQGAGEGTLVVTGRQKAGRGRRGRTWISPPDGNVYMSILLRPGIRADQAPMITLVMALAVWEAAREIRPAPGREVSFGIKWPNDIVASADGGPWKKVCGILTEMRLEETDIRDIVVGIGLNVNQRTFSEEISGTASSFSLAAGRSLDRSLLTAAVWKRFEKNYALFLEAGSLAPLKEAYEKALVNKGRTCRVLDPQAPFTGTALGINDRGELIVAPEEGGAPVSVGSGEISVRGAEGYI